MKTEERIQHRAESAFLWFGWPILWSILDNRMSGIEVPIKYGSNDGVTVRIYFIDLTEGGRHRETSYFKIID